MEKTLMKSIARMKKLNTTQKKYNRYAVKHNLLTANTLMCLLQKDYRQILKD